jgi:hypothetical protein
MSLRHRLARERNHGIVALTLAAWSPRVELGGIRQARYPEMTRAPSADRCWRLGKPAMWSSSTERPRRSSPAAT